MKRSYKFIVASAGCLSAFLVTQKLDGAIQREWWEVFIPIWCAIPAYFIITSLFIFIRNVLTSRDTSVDEIFDGESYISSLPYFLTFPLMFLRYNNLIVMPVEVYINPLFTDAFSYNNHGHCLFGLYTICNKELL